MKWILITALALLPACCPQINMKAAIIPNTDSSVQGKIESVCLGGHSYWSPTSESRLGASLAQRLDDDGLPVKCKARE